MPKGGKNWQKKLARQCDASSFFSAKMEKQAQFSTLMLTNTLVNGCISFIFNKRAN